MAGLTGVFVLVLAADPKLAWSRSLTVVLFAGVASLSLLLGFVNVRAIAELGHPVNYQWLYYSNFMRSLDSYTALAALLSWRWIGVVLAACLALLLVAAPACPRHPAGGRCRPGRLVRPLPSSPSTCLGIGWFPRARGGPTSPKIQNALVARWARCSTPTPTRSWRRPDSLRPG